MRLRTIGLISTLVLGLLAGPLHAEAQEAGKVYRIGYLGSGSRGFTANHAVFRKSLRELGYVEGKNIVIKWSFSKGKGDRIHERAADLVRLNLDCIFTTGTPAVRAAKKATSTIPIVMLLVSNPVKRGLVASFSRPGRNITGFTIRSPGLSGKQLELLKEALPQATRIAFLRDVTRRNTEDYLREMEVAARAMGVELQSLEVRPPFDFGNAFRTAVKKHTEALVVQGSGFAASTLVNRIIKHAVKSRLPAMYSAQRFMRAGGLMYYGPDRFDHFRRGATYVDRILKGAKPSELPVEQPIKFNLEINLKTAKQLGVTIPPEVLYQATKVIR